MYMYCKMFNKVYFNMIWGLVVIRYFHSAVCLQPVNVLCSGGSRLEQIAARLTLSPVSASFYVFLRSFVDIIVCVYTGCTPSS